MVEIGRIVDFYTCMFNCVKIIHNDVLMMIFFKKIMPLLLCVSTNIEKKGGIKLLF